MAKAMMINRAAAAYWMPPCGNMTTLTMTALTKTTLTMTALTKTTLTKTTLTKTTWPS
jgi:hypothetical protein